MATTNNTATSDRYSLANQTVSRHVVCPKSARPGPKTYALATDGDCLLPEYKSGDIMICDPDQDPEPGDLVGIWWKDGSIQPSIKRLVFSLPPRSWWDMDGEAQAALCIEMLNPPTVMTAKLSAIEAVHKVIHVIKV